MLLFRNNKKSQYSKINDFFILDDDSINNTNNTNNKSNNKENIKLIYFYNNLIEKSYNFISFKFINNKIKIEDKLEDKIHNKLQDNIHNKLEDNKLEDNICISLKENINQYSSKGKYILYILGYTMDNYDKLILKCRYFSKCKIFNKKLYDVLLIIVNYNGSFMLYKYIINKKYKYKYLYDSTVQCQT
jgi:hypothetical protein